jgi:hypothetical protein
MRTRRTRALVAIILASLLVPAGLTPAAGYVAQRQVKVTLSAQERVRCNQKAVIRATIRSLANGKPVANQAVRWKFLQKRASRDRLSAYRTFTNRQGVAVVKVKFGPKAGKRIVQARIPGLKPKITVRCRGGLN